MHRPAPFHCGQQALPPEIPPHVPEVVPPLEKVVPLQEQSQPER
ncbi:MAG: hypothetical protein ABI995_11505 [Acidobacteriota bacterium]